MSEQSSQGQLGDAAGRTAPLPPPPPQRQTGSMAAEGAAAERDRAIAGFFVGLTELAEVATELARETMRQYKEEEAERARRAQAGPAQSKSMRGGY